MAGLRERKKVHVRTSIQREALRLFSEQGFDATTVEQIAEAAGISPATFYRYFTSKEDSVVTDEYDPIFVQSIMERPSDEPLIDAIRAVMSDVIVRYMVRDRDLLVARYELRKIDGRLGTAYAAATDIATKAHLDDLRSRIGAGLHPSSLRPL